MKSNVLVSTKNLDAQRQQIAGYIVQGKSITWIAKRLDLHRATVTKWSNEPAVKKLIEQYSASIIDRAKKRLIHNAYRAVTTLEEGMKGEANKEQIASAVHVLDRAGLGPAKTVDMNAKVKAVSDKDESELLAEVEQLEQEVNEVVVESD